MAKSYRDLKVWQSSIDLVERIYRLTASFPKSELYGLTSQLRRASVSIPSNLAEGWNRPSKRDYAKFVVMARGSNDELQTQLIIAKRLGFARAPSIDEAESHAQEIGRMLSGLSAWLNKVKE